MLLTLAFLFGFTTPSQAADISVVDVRRNITLSEDDPVYKDFYISGGPSVGLKKNLVVTAVRKINIRDASGANAVGEITVPVGQLKIIAVFDRVAVAREYTLLSRDELPMLEQIGIMTGDRIDLQGSFIDNSKPKPKRKVAEETPVAATTVTAIVPAVTVPEAVATPISAPIATPVAAPANPVVSANTKVDSLLKGGETLEKTADSGNNTLHE